MSESYGPGGAAISSAQVPAPLPGAGMTSDVLGAEAEGPSISSPEEGGGPWAGPKRGAPAEGGGNTPGPFSCAGVDVAHDAQRHVTAQQSNVSRRSGIASRRTEEFGLAQNGAKKYRIPRPGATRTNRSTLAVAAGQRPAGAVRRGFTTKSRRTRRRTKKTSRGEASGSITRPSFSSCSSCIPSCVFVPFVPWWLVFSNRSSGSLSRG